MASPENKGERTAARIKRLTADRGLERTGWSIIEWCAMRGFSPNTFYRMPVVDRPVTIAAGNKLIVTKKADEQWEEQRLAAARARRETAPSGAAA